MEDAQPAPSSLRGADSLILITHLLELRGHRSDVRIPILNDLVISLRPPLLSGRARISSEPCFRGKAVFWLLGGLYALLKQTHNNSNSNRPSTDAVLLCGSLLWLQYLYPAESDLHAAECQDKVKTFSGQGHNKQQDAAGCVHSHDRRMGQS